MENTVDAAIKRIRDFATKMHWTKSKLAVMAGMPPTTLRDFEDPDWNPNANTIRRIEAVIAQHQKTS